MNGFAGDEGQISCGAAGVMPGRAGVLLQRWALDLADEGERREVERLFPVLPAAVGKITRSEYKRPLIQYARELGWDSDRTLKRWIKRGRELSPPDLPPLDRPGELASWWARVMKHKVPDELLRLTGPRVAPAVEAPPEPLFDGKTGTADLPAVSTGVGAATVRAEEVVTPLASGFGASLERMRDHERHAYQDLATARAKVPRDEGEIKMCQAAWEKAHEALRKAEKDAEPLLLAAGELVRWSDVEKSLGEHLQALCQSLRSMPTRLATKLPMAPELFHKLSQSYQAELDKLFDRLAEVNFKPEPPES